MYIVFITFIILVVGFIIVARENYLKTEFRIAFVDASIENERYVVEEYIDKLGPAKILDVLEKEYPICHSQSHDLGKVIFEVSGDISIAIETCRNRCTDGCYHGVLMEAFEDFVSKENYLDNHIVLSDLKDKVDAICNDPATATFIRQGNCAHGVGHALMYLANYNIKESLGYCGLFKSKPLEYYCSNGAFMEYDIVYGKSDLNTKSLHYPCDTFTDFPAGCYRYKMQRLVRILGGTSAAAEECMQLDGFVRLGCFHGFGLAHIVEINENPSRILSVCKFGTSDDKKICIEGAVEKLSDHQEVQAQKACAFLEDSLKEFCQTAAQRKYHSVEKSFALYFDSQP